SINGTQVLGNFDIAADAGGVNRADDKVFSNITPNGNGQIVVQLGPASVDDAKISAIQVVPQPNLTTTPTPTVSGAASIWRVHCGGPQYVDSQGQTWAADTNFNGGSTYQTNNSISSTTDPALYDDERAGNPFTYTFNVPPGPYQVTLRFAEIFWGSPGQRVFNVSINGTQVLGNFDIVADTGGPDRADDKSYDNVTPDGNGQIVIQLGPASVDNAKLSAIQIIPQRLVGKANPGLASSADSEKVTPTPTPTATPTAVSRDFTVVAVPNISHGEPVRFFINLPQPSQATLSLFNLMGEKVFETTWEGAAGANTRVWPLQNQSHGMVASGLYLYVIKAQNGQAVEVKTGKVAVLH
ncbi:MAG TPA: malectin domain-containing carbohydrate-binding protein, partial [bacterium]|nr:malectin domain-containing carbohydrate-binding protein [bacterium]